MAGGGKPARSDKPSIKYKYTPLDGVFFELAEFDREDCHSSSSDNKKQNGRKIEPGSVNRLSTAELVSAVGQIWDCASGTLSVFKPKTTYEHHTRDLRNGNIVFYPANEGHGRSSASAEVQYFSVDSFDTSCSSAMVQPKIDYPTVTQKLSVFDQCSEHHIYSILPRFLQNVSNMPTESCNEKGCSSVGVSCDLANAYGWMSAIAFPRLKHQVDSTHIDKKKTGDCFSTGDTRIPAAGSVSVNVSSLVNGSIAANADFHTERVKYVDLPSGQSAEFITNASTVTSALYLDYRLEPVQDMKGNVSVATVPVSRLHADYYITDLASSISVSEERQHNFEGAVHENQRDEQKDFVNEDKSKVEVCLSTKDKLHYTFAKQGHAFAGALAGISVSLCLHPVDTIKTVIQSCRAGREPIQHTIRSIISERGVTGLYRGITSNIASSAPISAVYTFTYESVKGALLPLLSKEYHSLAHCMAGGCASIATSFIFTPSERIKQQMQVGTHYQNCWNVLIGSIEKGGLSSLYAGWGAVLCRNVPHSIIKFYTYESLKRLMSSSLQLKAQPNTFLTLVCGGVAASTAALFTTPFDVVKTRLQTQIPGSMTQYNGVFNTLINIARHEGLKGLYRGLTPRLVIYMTQGALFFASYESFKRLFSLEMPQLDAQKIQDEQYTEDNVTFL
ncbi:hypothetical protein RJ639_033791 [Escallonia herrerae]|uniref:Mitochondrial substrate carrier family protein n=1 Tax=Escallonia herrerae TaxID=1293975 RepID=A0AA89BAH2_9ASTE|nr:hypothetical protein RJ639_033791 [Escallonia herrerae]